MVEWMVSDLVILLLSRIVHVLFFCIILLQRSTMMSMNVYKTMIFQELYAILKIIVSLLV